MKLLTFLNLLVAILIGILFMLNPVFGVTVAWALTAAGVVGGIWTNLLLLQAFKPSEDIFSNQNSRGTKLGIFLAIVGGVTLGILTPYAVAISSLLTASLLTVVLSIMLCNRYCNRTLLNEIVQDANADAIELQQIPNALVQSTYVSSVPSDAQIQPMQDQVEQQKNANHSPALFALPGSSQPVEDQTGLPSNSDLGTYEYEDSKPEVSVHQMSHKI